MFFTCLFPLDVQNEIQLLSGMFCYSWLVCLCHLSKSEIRFRMALFSFFALLDAQRVEKSEVILVALLDTFQGCISNGKPE